MMQDAFLFAVSDMERRKAILNQLFQESIQLCGQRDPAHHFWVKSLRTTHGAELEPDVRRAINQYANELQDWLALNYPTRHWISTGIYSRMDHILSAH